MLSKVILNNMNEPDKIDKVYANVLKPIVKGENPINDTLIKEVFRIPDKTEVFHCNTDRIIMPIEFIGGRETRSIGDTCSMFYKINHSNKPADYYFWNGIVSEDLNELVYNSNDNKHVFLHGEIGEKLYDIFPNVTNDFGLATGRTNHRIVLLEKTKKASRSRKAF